MLHSYTLYVFHSYFKKDFRNYLLFHRKSTTSYNFSMKFDELNCCTLSNPCLEISEVTIIDLIILLANIYNS